MVDGSTVAQEQPEAASGVAGGAPKQMAWGSGAALVRKEVELPPSLELLEVQLERATRVSSHAQIASAHLELNERLREQHRQAQTASEEFYRAGVDRRVRAQERVQRLREELQVAERELEEAEAKEAELAAGMEASTAKARALERAGRELEHQAHREVGKAENSSSAPIAGRLLEATWQYKGVYPGDAVRPTWEHPRPKEEESDEEPEPEETPEELQAQALGGQPRTKRHRHRSEPKPSRQDVADYLRGLQAANEARSAPLAAHGAAAGDALQKQQTRREIDGWFEKLRRGGPGSGKPY